LKVNFSDINLHEPPVLILKGADETPIGVLGYARNVEFQPKYNELSVLSFELPAMVDGEPTPFYDDVVGHRIIELQGIGQFTVQTPTDSGDALTRAKKVTADSLEKEFARKTITIAESTFKFFDSVNPDGTMLGMIMELMPNWRVGAVADSLKNRFRTFALNGENLYNVIKGTLQEAYNCIFEFDTLRRTVNVRDADDTPVQKQVYISRENLAKDIEVAEQTEDMVTRLDVNGAEGVDIREVNPTGDNVIVNLDYFMTTDNFDQPMIDKYQAWRTLVGENKLPFYNAAVNYSLLVGEETAENAKLVDLQGEYTSLENIQSTIIQGISEGIKSQSDLDDINAQLAAKQAELDAKQAEITAIAAEREHAMADMVAIRDACAYQHYFTEAEQKRLDLYLFDNSIQEESFVASEVQSYTEGIGRSIAGETVRVTGAEITKTTTAGGAELYAVTGGSIVAAQEITGAVVSAVFEKRTDGKIVASAYIGNGAYGGVSFPSACISISGSGSLAHTGGQITLTATDATLYFTLNASEYEKKAVAWELYEYGETLLDKMCRPSYSFSVSSANFIALEDFELFKNELELGQRIYIQVGDDLVIKPICTGATFGWADISKLTLTFNDTFTVNDSEAKLVEMLDAGVSAGKKLSGNQYAYQAWTGSGASTRLHEFIISSLDTAKNAIISSTDQAVSWDGAGLRLRKWANSAHTAYEPEQVWMSNNSIAMTDDGWATAKMAIGKFVDRNVGEVWGVIAPAIVGTILAGESLVVESQKKDGGIAVFKMDGDGCRLYNSEFTIQKTGSSGKTTQILMNPDVGIAIGEYPLVKQDGTLDTTKAKFYADDNGNLTLTGNINAAGGLIANWNISTDRLYNGSGGSYVALSADPLSNYRIWAGAEDPTKAAFSVQKDGTAIASNLTINGGAITIKNGSTVNFNVTNQGILTANGAVINGTLTAGAGSVIGGWTIGAKTFYSGSGDNYVCLDSGTAGQAYAIWAGGDAPAAANFRVGRDGSLVATSASITGAINSGSTITGATITGGSINIASGLFSVDAAGNLVASKATITGAINSGSTITGATITGGSINIASGLFSVDASGNLVASRATITGAINSGSTITGATITGGSINIASGKFNVDANGNLTATSASITGSINTGSSITCGTFSVTSAGVVTITQGEIQLGTGYNVTHLFNDGSAYFGGGYNKYNARGLNIQSNGSVVGYSITADYITADTNLNATQINLGGMILNNAKTITNVTTIAADNGNIHALNYTDWHGAADGTPGAGRWHVNYNGNAYFTKVYYRKEVNRKPEEGGPYYEWTEYAR